MFEEHLIAGPFALFTHVHRFQAEGAATRVTDELEVRLRWWLGGELATRILVAPRLRRAFAARHAALSRLIEAGAL